MSVLPVRQYDENRTLLVRDGLLLVFFSRVPFPKMAAGADAILGEWLKLIPPNTIRWARVGANAEDISPADAKTISRCRGMLDPKKAEKKDITKFSLEGPEDTNPDFRFQVFGTKEVRQAGRLQETNVIEMYFPTEFLTEITSSRFVEFACTAAAAIPYDSGYCSVALNWVGEAMLRAAAAVMVPLALRHPGFDVHRNMFTRSILGGHCRGPGWLTFLSKTIANTLGGEESLRARLDPAVTVIPAGEGFAIRAGDTPEIGDVNRQEDVPLLRSVARAIEPVTFASDTLVEAGIFRGDSDKFQRWTKRLLSTATAPPSL